MVTEAMQCDEELSRISEEALDDTGYVLSIEAGLTTTDGNVKKATATYYEVFGVNTVSTKDMDGTAQADVEVPVKRTGAYRVQLAANAGRSTAIVPGDTVAVLDAGKVAHIDDCPCKVGDTSGSDVSDSIEKLLKCVVGRALESCLASADTTDGKILVRLGLP